MRHYRQREEGDVDSFLTRLGDACIIVLVVAVLVWQTLKGWQ